MEIYKTTSRTLLPAFTSNSLGDVVGHEYSSEFFVRNFSASCEEVLAE